MLVLLVILFTVKLYARINIFKTKSDNANTTNEFRFFLESNFAGVNRLFGFSLYRSRCCF